MSLTRPTIAAALILTALSACTGEREERGLRTACEGGLDIAYRELNQAEADGFSSSVKWTKAASLLAAAKVQEQFEEYQNCVEKVAQAREYLREIRG